jgi:hypothetical protein
MKFTICLVLILSLASSSLGDELSEKESDLFEIYVRPTLVNRCIKCHGEEQQEGGLSLANLASIQQGGESGPAIELGNVDKSLLMSAIRHESLEMPPDGKLDASIIDGIAAWISAGAPWPHSTTLKALTKITDNDRQWWCYQPIFDPVVPSCQDNGWCKNEIDQFVFDKLAGNGVVPSPQATPGELLRRLSFDLTGLPPKATLLEKADLTSGEYEELIESLLDSVAFGEQQARYWLDLVRYAESDGYRADAERPHARLYRDYVIAAMNDDLPYDQFILQQLAGDELFPGDRNAIVATMYLRHWIYEHNQRDVEQQWHEILNDITETTADVFLAQGLKCARCHDHKFDPLLQKDFYRMKAFFAALMPCEEMPVASTEQRAAYNQQFHEWELATEEIRKQLYSIEHPVLLANATREGFDKFIDEIKQMVRKFPSDRAPYEKQIAGMAERQYDVHPEKLPELLDVPTARQRVLLRNQLASFDHLKPSPLPTVAFVATDVGPVAPETYINRDSSRPAVAPGFLTIICAEDATIPDTASSLKTTGRRAALARWMTAPKNPLVTRVIVNRIWQQHFGVGLVATSSDFGRLGTPPSHPELLDWLASRLIEDQWSLKSLHRRIVESATYRQSSMRPMDAALRTIDPSNRLLWKMNPRRLSGEEIRDTLLSASGELGQEGRTIYQPVMRNSPNPLLSSFDGPDRIRSVGERHRTITSTQALLMMNSEWVLERTSKLAERFSAQRDDHYIESLYQELYARLPTHEETDDAKQFLYDYVLVVDQQQQQNSTDIERAVKSRRALAHLLINSNEMIYVD